MGGGGVGWGGVGGGGGGGCLCGMSVPCSNKTLWRCSVTSHRGRTGSPIIFNCFNSLGSLVF